MTSLRNTTFYGAVGALLCSSFSVSAETAELRSINESVDAGVNTSYVFTRCAALYSSIILRGGEHRLGHENFDYMKEKAALFFIFGYDFAASEMGVPLDIAKQSIEGDLQRIKLLYITRMNQNYAMTSVAYAEDPVMSSDMVFCNSLAERTRL